MTTHFLTIDETKQQIAKRFDDGWMFLFDNLDGMMITAIENQYYQGEKNADFEVFTITTKDKKICPLYLVKKEHYPFNKDTQNIENIRGLLITFIDGDLKLKSLRSNGGSSMENLDEILKAGGIEL